MHIQTLTASWSIRPLNAFAGGAYPDDDTWIPTAVPSHWQQQPELATHVGKVVYRCRFDHNARAATTNRYWLKVNGAFYWSHPYLNGHDLGRHEGYFIPYEHEVTAALARDNILLIEVDCPEERDKFRKQMITGVFSHWDCFDPTANPGGIWLPVELHQSGPVRCHTVRCHTEVFDDHFAQLRYAAELDATEAGVVLLRWTLTPQTFTGETQVIEQRRVLSAGHQQIGGLLKLREPHLWWTHDLGDPNLYTVTLDVVCADTLSDQYSFSFGVRRFELRDWIPHLNGVRFLAKGNNYAPGDVRIATMNRERCAHDVKLARECHMNILRVHAHVDHPTFYEEANKAGVLLWQDMPLQWIYRPTILLEAQRQARAMVHLLYNHPSVAIWCMHNEAMFIADTADEALITRLRTYNTAFGFSWNRDIMDTQLKRVAEKVDPMRPVIRSSGEFDIPYLRKGTDAHAYFGWYRSYGTLREAELLRRRFPDNLRFITEFGAQSFPNLESSLKFLPADVADLDVDHLVAQHGLQANIMSNWLPWREAESLAEIITMTQEYQVFINRYYIDRLRYHKYRPTGGVVPFVFIDPFPAILWSVVDYWRVPKRSYYAMQMAFSPQYTFALFDPRERRIAEPVNIPIYVVNDDQRPARDIRLVARLRSPGGDLLAEVAHTLYLEADCLAYEVDHLRLTPTEAGRYIIELELTGGERDVQHSYELAVV